MVGIKKETGMQTTILKNDGKNYGGKYVAIRSFKNNEIICSGKNHTWVYNRAKKKARNPVIFYVPPKNTIHMY